MNEWLIHHTDEALFHKLCYDSSMTTKQINDYLAEHGNASALVIDANHGMTPLHMLAMHHHALDDAIAALLDINLEVAFRMDRKGKMSLDYARDCNVSGLIGMIKSLYNYKNSSIPVESDTDRGNISKRRNL